MPRLGGTGGGGGGFQNLNIVFGLYLYARINPSIWDALIPMGPKYSKGTINVIAAQVIKTVSHSMRGDGLSEELNKIGNELYTSGTSAMNYEDDDWRCGNVPIHWPHFGIEEFFFAGSEAELNPQPQPPGEKYYAAVLNLVTESINDSEISEKLKNIIAGMIGNE